MMELQTGICFLCCDVKVIAPSEAAKAFEIICTLFSKKSVDILKFKSIESSLALCPICYHELIILKRLKKNIEECIDIDKSESNCYLCNHDEILFKFDNWRYFDEISEDLGYNINDNCITCSDCLFYLHTSHKLKAKLISRYPLLDTRTQNTCKTRQKPKSKNTATFVQSRLSERRDRNRTVKNLTQCVNIEDIVEDKKWSKRNININSIKNFKPLKHSKIFKLHRRVQTDTKLFNEIPYVLLKVVNIPFDRTEIDNGTMHKSPHIKCDEVDIKETNETKTMQQTIHSKFNINMDIDRYLIKNLIVKLSRIEMSENQKLQMLGSKNNLSNTDQLNDTCNDIQNTKEVYSQQESSLQSSKVFQEKEASSKTKRKSVSFAEDKNVEIEYYEKEATQSINNGEKKECSSANRNDTRISEKDDKSNSEKNYETLSEKPVLEIENENIDKQGLYLFDKDLQQPIEKVFSNDAIEHSQSKINDLICENSQKSRRYPPKPHSKKAKVKFTAELDSRSEAMEEANNFDETLNDTTTSDTVQLMENEKNSFSNNEENVNLSDTLELPFTDKFLNEEHSTNTYEQTEEKEKEYTRSKVLKKAKDSKMSTHKKKENNDLSNLEIGKSNTIEIEEKSKDDIRLDDGKNVLNSENMSLDTEFNISDPHEESQLLNVDSNCGNESFSDSKDIVNTKNDKPESESEGIINEFEHFNQSSNKESHAYVNENINENTTETVDISTFSDSDKNDVDITEDEKNNINSILSGLILQQDQLEDTVFEKKDECVRFETEETTGNTDTNYSVKRKISDQEIGSHTEKKKKRVTFCEDVT